MTNEKNNNKLDEKIKQSLSEYEPSYDNADWVKMESLLGPAPKPTTFKWSYVVIVFSALLVLSGGYFLYSKFSSSESSEKTDVSIPLNTVKDTSTGIVTTPVTPATTPVPEVSPPPSDLQIETPPLVDEPTLKQKDTEVVKDDNRLEKELPKKEKERDRKDRNSSVENKTDFNNHEEILKKNDEHVFGDSPDSTKGNSVEQTEESGTKKVALPSTNGPVGWNKFALSNVNPDSIKKHREQMKNDSLK